MQKHIVLKCRDLRSVGNRTQQILTRANGESTVRPFDLETATPGQQAEGTLRRSCNHIFEPISGSGHHYFNLIQFLSRLTWQTFPRLTRLLLYKMSPALKVAIHNFYQQIILYSKVL